jgi:predicted DNA-binding transcriptional regulator YafY
LRGRNITQILKAVDLLSQPEGTSINHLSRVLEIDRRSVYRLLDTIQDLGFPVYDDAGEHGREKTWKLDSDYILKLPNITLPDIRLNLSEIIALYLLRTESGLYSGTDIERRIDSAFSKLSQFVPREFHSRVHKLKSLFVSCKQLTKDYSGKEEIIDTLAKAMLNNKTCVVSYFSFMDEKTKRFRIDPLHFFESSGGLYLFVRVTRFDEIRILAVERIESLDELDDTFDYPDDFDPQAKLELAFDIIYDETIELEVIFSSSQAKYIRERKFSPEQEIINNPDGSVTLKMSTSGWFDIKRWILGFGSDARVVSPVKLKEEIKKEMQATLDEYVNS